MTEQAERQEVSATGRLSRTLSLWNLVVIGVVVIGVVVIQPTAPMGIYGVVSNRVHGHVVTTILIAMVAMLFTAVSYGCMARKYPSAGSAYTYVSCETNSLLGYIVGWGLVMDYLLDPLICTAFCAKAAENIVPGVSYYIWVLIFSACFTWMGVRGVKTSACVNEVMCIAMSIVVLIFLIAVARSVWGGPYAEPDLMLPFYNAATFNFSSVLGGTSVAVLTYIGFDAVSTLSEEARNPRRKILLATILVCLIAGVLSSLEVYAAELVWGSQLFAGNEVESAFALLSRRVGGVALFRAINLTLLVANMGSGIGSQLAAGGFFTEWAAATRCHGPFSV